MNTNTYTMRQIRLHLLRLQYMVQSMQCLARLRHEMLPSRFLSDSHSRFTFCWSHTNKGTIEKDRQVYSLHDIAAFDNDTQDRFLDWLMDIDLSD